MVVCCSLLDVVGCFCCCLLLVVCGVLLRVVVCLWFARCRFVVVWTALLVACSLVYVVVVRCLAGRWLCFVGRRSVLRIACLLSLFGVCCWLVVIVWCLLYVVCRLLMLACCLLRVVVCC